LDLHHAEERAVKRGYEESQGKGCGEAGEFNMPSKRGVYVEAKHPFVSGEEEGRGLCV
jgi:hypothetical protein